MKVTGIGGLTIQPSVATTNDYGKQAWVIAGQMEVRGRISTQGDICNFTYKMYTQKQAEYNIKKLNVNAGFVFMGELSIINGVPTIEVTDIIEHTTNNYYFTNGQRGATGARYGATAAQPTQQVQTVNRPAAVQPTAQPVYQTTNDVPRFPSRLGAAPAYQTPAGMPVIDLNTVGME